MRIKGQLSPEQGKALFAQLGAKEQQKTGNKFHAESTTTEHGNFDSKHEARAVASLETMRMRGQICNLRKQVPYDLVVNGVLITRYVVDAVFEAKEEFEMITLAGPKLLREGERVVIDAKCKATKTPQYRIKKQLMRACLGIEILEV